MFQNIKPLAKHCLSEVVGGGGVCLTKLKSKFMPE
jgi:hypothetical protein